MCTCKRTWVAEQMKVAFLCQIEPRYLRGRDPTFSMIESLVNTLSISPLDTHDDRVCQPRGLGLPNGFVV